MVLCLPDRPAAFSWHASNKKMLMRYNITLQSLPHSSALIGYVYSLDQQAATSGLQKWVSVCLRGPKPSIDMVALKLRLEFNTVLLRHFFGFYLEVLVASCEWVKVVVFRRLLSAMKNDLFDIRSVIQLIFRDE